MTYIKVDPCSTRLGNWMFQYAAAKSAAPSEQFAFLVRGDQSTAAVERYAAFWPDVPIVREAPAGAQVRQGLFQDYRSLDPEVVKGLFRCPAEVEERIAVRYGGLFDDPGLVSVHVRRTDYLQLPHRHPFVGERYLIEAVRRVVELRRGKEATSFFVCSDDIPWCRRFFARREFAGLAFRFSEGNDVMTDLFLMAKCRGGHICSNSSFSFWGAYLGALACPSAAATTVFPSMWFGPAIKDADWSGMYFPGSVVLKNGYTFPRYVLARVHMFKNACGSLARKLGLRS